MSLLPCLSFASNFYFRRALPSFLRSFVPLLLSYAPPTKLPIAASYLHGLFRNRQSGESERAPIALSLSLSLLLANGNGPSFLLRLLHSFIQDRHSSQPKDPLHLTLLKRFPLAGGSRNAVHIPSLRSRARPVSFDDSIEPRGSRLCYSGMKRFAFLQQVRHPRTRRNHPVVCGGSG